MTDAVDRVLAVVAGIPPGRVASYGDVGAVAGVSARQVGWIMARHGEELPWWRVTNARGELPPHLLPEAYARWAAEGIGICPGRCEIAGHRIGRSELAERWG